MEGAGLHPSRIGQRGKALESRSWCSVHRSRILAWESRFLSMGGRLLSNGQVRKAQYFPKIVQDCSFEERL